MPTANGYPVYLQDTGETGWAHLALGTLSAYTGLNVYGGGIVASGQPITCGNFIAAAGTLSQPIGNNPDSDSAANRQLRLVDSGNGTVWGYFARWAGSYNRFALGGVSYVATDAGSLTIASGFGTALYLGSNSGFVTQTGLEHLTDGNSVLIRAGSSTSTPRLQIQSAVSGTGDILRCTDSALTTLAKIDYQGNLSAAAGTFGTYPSAPSVPLRVGVDGAGRGLLVASTATDFVEIIAGGIQKGIRVQGSVPFLIDATLGTTFTGDVTATRLALGGFAPSTYNHIFNIKCIFFRYRGE